MTLIKNASLRFRLIVVISLTALIIWTISTTVAWFQARQEINTVFDAQQILFAKRLASSNLHTLLTDHPPTHKIKKPKKRKRHLDFDDDALAFAVFTEDGEKVLSDGHSGNYFNYASYTPENDFSIARLDGDDDDWRIFWLPTADHLVIAVGQEIDYRDDMVEEMVLSQMWIWFASLPLLIGLVIWIINRELHSLKQVSQQLQQRTPEDNQALSTDVPTEILPLVQNLNRFFDRTATMLLRERRFTSDAAHELRSPLAALKIQTEIAQIAGDDTLLREKALNNLTQGINRASQLIEQLLTLSRLDNLTELDGLEAIHWEKLLPSLLGELYFNAQKRHIDLAFEPLAAPKTQQGQPLLLALMVRNLVENAIKYCPEGTQVCLFLEKDKLIIADNGGGVDERDLTKLGQRFFRPAGQNEKGSGLGLSIVHRIAELHHYQLKIENGYEINGQKGLKITLFF
ncbi:sensor protein QseC [[Actinobacillus] muris]|uniref:Sensor protein QseC n=1 Tax=Muribacter muris TaxID=67855 RepID=A0A0J5P9T5_9PAST|nr:quorum sensing histidine kinase QseC [Muribacter muris]KMK52495.1 sensor protein QseC [[Actinobacillus] muris] [Muribacter muris]